MKTPDGERSAGSTGTGRKVFQQRPGSRFEPDAARSKSGSRHSRRCAITQGALRRQRWDLSPELLRCNAYDALAARAPSSWDGDKKPDTSLPATAAEVAFAIGALSISIASPFDNDGLRVCPTSAHENWLDCAAAIGGSFVASKLVGTERRRAGLCRP